MASMIKYGTLLLALGLAMASAVAQISQRGERGEATQIRGNTEINASAENMTAVANGENNVAKNRVGVIQGGKHGDTKINVNVKNVTTVTGGRNKKACTNIGSIVNEECK